MGVRSHYPLHVRKGIESISGHFIFVAQFTYFTFRFGAFDESRQTMQQNES